VSTIAVVLSFLLPVYRNTVYLVPQYGTFVSWYRQDALWAALTHDVSSLTRSIRTADALLLGSSKTLFGLSASLLNERFRSQNIKFFNLGIEGGEGAMAAARVIDDLGLSNKILLINLDDNMLSDYESEEMRSAERMDWFQAAVRVYSTRADAIAETLLDRLGLPRLNIGSSIALNDRLLPRGIRDPLTGDALPVTAEDFAEPDVENGYLLEPAPVGQMFLATTLERSFLRKIFLNWQARRMRFVFLTIPYGSPNPRGNNYTPNLPQLAAQLYGGVSVAIDWHGLASPDHIHLTRVSRMKVTERVAGSLAAVDLLSNLRQ